MDRVDLFNRLYAELAASFGQRSFPDRNLLLAHYTSMNVVASIIGNEEMWFSNPLFMNDLEEMRFGLNVSGLRFEQSLQVDEACSTKERSRLAKDKFRYYFDKYEVEHVIDVYVCCFSEHNADNLDGQLSMWRAYGSQGNGAAVIFTTGDVKEIPDSPILIAKVRYGTAMERIKWIDDAILIWCKFLTTTFVSDSDLDVAVAALFDVLKLHALTTKHRGFAEEREWRAIYFPERDHKKLLIDKFDYVIGKNGVEPKLKFKMESIEGVTAPNFDFDKTIYQVILGPTVSSPLARASFTKMLNKIGKHYLSEKVVASSIPLRPSS